MPDYNLGRAHGEITITSDTRGAQEAQAAMAATSAEATVLDKNMSRVTDTFEKNRKETTLSAEAIVRQRQQVEELRKTYQRYHDDYERGAKRSKEATEAFDRARKEGSDDYKTILRLANDADKARENEERLLNRVTEAHTKYQTRLASVRQEVEKFNQAHLQATSFMSNMRFEAERTGQALEKLSSVMSSVLKVVGQAGIMGMFGLGSAGITAAGAAGGLSSITNVLAGVMESVQQLSGVLALLPAVASAGAVSLGTLALGFHGVGQAIQSMGDPQKFIESLRELSPIAREAMTTLYSFSNAFRGVQHAIQDSLFAPIIADLQPLIYTWLPLLQEGGKAVANQFGQMAHQVLQFFQTPAAQSAFTTLIGNMTKGFQAASGAIQPFLQAWQTLMTIGSGSFERIGAAITTIAEKFNNWIQTAASNGSLDSWINRALTGFTDLGNIILNTVEAINQIFLIGDKYGGGFLEYIRVLSEEFKNWTISSEGQQTLSNFFNLIQQAGAAIHPILKLIGEGFATVAGALTRLGINIAPAATQFFKDIVDALHSLAPVVQQIGPSISTFLVEFGQALLSVVQQIGPQLPKIFEGLSQALILLLPVLPKAAELLVAILNHLTPKEVEGIFLAAVAIKGMAVAFGLLTIALDASPIGLVSAAIIALGAAFIYAYDHSKTFHDAINGIVDTLSHLGEEAVNAVKSGWHHLEDWFNNLDWLSKGKKLAQDFIDGLLGKSNDVSTAAVQLMSSASAPVPQSRAKIGPFSQASPTEMGAKLSTDYAAGIASGTGAVSGASLGVANAAAGGTTGTPFSTAGAAGRSGVGVTSGNSGFDQYINFLTKDLTAWNNIFRDAFNIVQQAANAVVSGIKIVASIWGGGNNPLTQPGGIAGPPVPVGQQNVPGVTGVPTPGVAPIPALAPLGRGGQVPGQITPPGITPVGPHGTGPTPGQPGFIGPVAVPTPAPSAAPAASGAPLQPGGQLTSRQADISNRIIAEGRKRGMTDPQIKAALAIAADESNLGQNDVFNTSGGNASVGGVGGIYQQAPGAGWGTKEQVMDPSYSIPKFFDAYQQNLKNFTDPMAAAVHTQNPQLGTSPQGSDYWNQVQAATGRGPYQAALGGLNAPIPGAPAPVGAPGGPIPGAAVNPLTRANFPLQGTTTQAFKASGDTNPPLYPPGSNTGGYGGPGQSVLPDWVKKFADRFGLVASTYPEGGTLHQAGYAFDFVPKPGNQDPAGSMDAFATFIQQNLSPQTLELIHFNERTGQKWGIAGAKDVRGTGYYESPNAYGEHGDYGQGAHVHWATDVPPVLPGINAPAAGPPPPTNAPASTTGGVPTADSGGGLGLGAAAVAGAGVLSAVVLRRMSSAARLRWLQYNYNRLDAKAKADVIDSLSPQERALIGKNPEVAFGPEGAVSQEARGLIVDLGGTPPTAPTQGPAPRYTAPSPADVNATQPIDIGPSIASRYKPTGGIPLSEGAPGGVPDIVPPAAPAAPAPTPVAPEPTPGIGLRGGLRIAGRALGPGLAVAGAFPWAWDAAHNIAGNQQYQREPTLGDVLTGRQTTGAIDTSPISRPMTPEEIAKYSRPGPGQPALGGLPGAQAERRGLTPSAAGSTPVHVTNPSDLPGGRTADIPVAPTTSSIPIIPGGGGPGAQAERRGLITPGAGTAAGASLAPIAAVATGASAAQGKLPFNAQTPLDAFASGLSSVGSIASDAFQVFDDIIQNISATAKIADTLVRGVANTEDIVGIVKNVQTYIKTAADVAKTVGDVGSMVGGAGSGDPTGMTAAVGSAIQLVAGLVQSGLQITNEAISLGIEVYHEVGKYAGFIIGGFLGGDATGPLGGNVRMLLNTRTNQLLTYGEDNPLNKNTFNVPGWQRSYTQQPTPVQNRQVNIYTGPGQTPSGMMNEAMWNINTGSAPVASVAGLD